MVQKGQYVRLHTNDDWNGLYGIIDYATDEIIAVFCVAMPFLNYYVRRDGSEAQVLEFINIKN
jgi:hypothetical protein